MCQKRTPEASWGWLEMPPLSAKSQEVGWVGFAFPNQQRPALPVLRQESIAEAGWHCQWRSEYLVSKSTDLQSVDIHTILGAFWHLNGKTKTQQVMQVIGEASDPVWWTKTPHVVDMA